MTSAMTDDEQHTTRNILSHMMYLPCRQQKLPPNNLCWSVITGQETSVDETEVESGDYDLEGETMVRITVCHSHEAKKPERIDKCVTVSPLIRVCQVR